MVISKEVDTNNLPSSVVNAVRSIVKSRMSDTPKSLAPRGAADHLNYKITIDEGTKKSVIECNQYDIDDKLKSLISYVEKKSK